MSPTRPYFTRGLIHVPIAIGLLSKISSWAMSRSARLLVALAASVDGFVVVTARSAVPRVPPRASRPALIEPDAAKITIRKPAAAASATTGSSTTTSSGAKVTVRVRSPSESAAAAATPAVADLLDDDSMTVSSVTVKAPAAVVAPPSAPAGPALTEAEKLLLSATQRANCSQILEALREGANPNVRDPKGRTPLHFVAGVGLAPATMLLCHFGAQLDARDEDGLTPLHMAAGYANSQTLRVLVAAGADPTLTAKVQGTAAEVVCALGDYQLQQFLETRNRFKKKDEKLEKLKACMDVLDDPEAVRTEANWDEMLTEVMKAIGGTSDSNAV